MNVVFLKTSNYDKTIINWYVLIGRFLDFEND